VNIASATAFGSCRSSGRPRIAGISVFLLTNLLSILPFLSSNGKSVGEMSRLHSMTSGQNV